MKFFSIVLLTSVVLKAADFNPIVLQQIREMPVGGGYETTREAHQALNRAVVSLKPELQLNASLARPSYCSSATYLLFLKTLASIQKSPSSHVVPLPVAELLPKPSADGVGIWGRWNSNGPGTARLFHELGLGKNFTSWEEARPGDFMKIFWTNEVGARERGHSVVFLGVEMKDGVESVRFWSSNKPGGYGEKLVPKSKVAAAIFSRLENPEAILQAAALTKRDNYLASLLARQSSMEEACRMVGIQR